MKDFNGLLWEYLRKGIKTISIRLYTSYNYFKLYLIKVPIGKNCLFFGNTKIIRRHNSRIIIGMFVQFRSTLNSNQFGIYKKNSLCTLKSNAEIIIGDGCGMSGCSISAAKSIVMGKNVFLGANVIISDFDWHGVIDRNNPKTKQIVINDNVWVGANSIILKGVIIGQNTTIGAGSIVTKEIPMNCIAAGNPCKVIKYITDES